MYAGNYVTRLVNKFRQAARCCSGYQLIGGQCIRKLGMYFIMIIILHKIIIINIYIYIYIYIIIIYIYTVIILFILVISFLYNNNYYY